MANQITVNVRQSSSTTSEGSAREHRVLIDRPEAKGGTNRGAMGGEHLLIALGGCFMSNLLEAVRTRDAQVSDLEVEIVGTLESAPSRYTAITMNITGHYVDAEQMQKLVEISERACIVANTLKGSLPLTLHLAQKQPTAS